MRLTSYLVLSFFLTLIQVDSWAQTKPKRDRFPSYFGLTASPVIPNNFVGAVNTPIVDTNTTTTMFSNFHNSWGFTFGATARIGLTKTISIETGIAQVTRNYLVTVDIPDSSVYASQKLTFVNYDIPINGLFYVQLSENWYMNAAIGASITQYPSNVVDTMLPGTGRRIEAVGQRIKRTHGAINGGLGFEYRTEKSGTFYLGGGVKIPMAPIFIAETRFKQTGSQTVLYGNAGIVGGYFTLDIRYFFPTPKKKTEGGPKPLIE